MSHSQQSSQIPNPYPSSSSFLTIIRLGLPYKKNLNFFKNPRDQKRLTSHENTFPELIINDSMCVFGFTLSKHSIFADYTCTF